jgi:molecular chaperone HscB
MAWREELEESRSGEDLDRLRDELEKARASTLGRIGKLLDDSGDAATAAQQVRALMFIERFAHDVEARFEQLGQ